jgi:O-antigen ligase
LNSRSRHRRSRGAHSRASHWETNLGAWSNRIQQGVSIRFLGAFALTLFALVLGGASRPEILSNTVVAALAIAFLAILLADYRSYLAVPVPRNSLIIILAICSIPVLQLVPIPRFIFNLLGDSQVRPQAIEPYLGYFRQISVAPRSTLESVGFLAIPVSLFLAILVLGYRQRRWLIYLILCVSAISFFLGLLQVLGDPNGGLYFYSITNNGRTVGFFSNRNHLAALFYCSILLAAPLIFADRASRSRQSHPIQSNRNNDLELIQKYFLPVVGSIAILLLILGITLTTSRAGVALGFLAIGLSLLVCRPTSNAQSHTGRFQYLVLALILAVLAGVYYGLEILIQRFNASGLELDAGRSQFNAVTWRIILDNFPIGTGFGTFEQVYKAYEPIETITVAEANRAHNEYFEWLQEGGIFSALALCAALVWLLFAFRRVWGNVSGCENSVDLLLMRSAAFVPVLLLLHSAVDYPMRTAALASVAAICCAMTIPPLKSNRDDRARGSARE